MNKPQLKAQILLVTILVLMIISIIVVGGISLANRDVSQSLSEQQYQQILNVSESQLLEYINSYGADAGVYDAIVSANPNCIRVSSAEVECTLDQTQDGVDTVLNIEDTKEIEGFELTKDDSFELNLAYDSITPRGFRGQIVFNYTGDVALEFALTYINAGQVAVISDVFDLTAGQVLDISQGDPLDNADPKHPLNFGQSVSGDYTFLINAIDGLPGTAQPLSLRITARMAPSESVTLLDISGNSGGLSLAVAGTFPDQARKYLANSYFAGEDANIATSVATYVPLLPQAASFLHHGLLTPDDLSK